MPDPKNPLTEQDFERLTEGLQAAQTAIAQAEMAERAGLDVAPLMERAKQSRDQLLKIKNIYFPGR